MRKNTNSDNITITEIFSGIKAKMRYFGKHCLDANGDVMPFNEQMAIVSHYLHNEKFASEKTYKEKALGLIEDIYEMKTGKEITKEGELSLSFFGRSDRIRTCGLLVPNQAHYQTVPHPDLFLTPMYYIKMELICQ